MAGNIKGITVEIGANTTGLSKALEDVNKHSKSLQSELRQVESLLKLNPGNTELVAQKQQLLAAAVTSTKEKLDTLKQAQAQVDEQFRNGQINEEQYRAFQREVAKTEGELNKLEGELANVSSTSQKTGDSVDDAGKATKTAGNEMDTAAKKTSGFGDSLGKIAKGLSKAVVGGMVALGTAAATAGKKLYDMANATAQAADNIDKQSQKLGMSRQTFQEWDYILSQNGVSIDSMNTAMKSMTAAMSDLDKGGKKGQETLAKLGVTVEDLKNLKQEEIFEKAVIALQKMPEGYEKARLAQQLFGKQGQELLPMLNTSKGSIEELKAKAHELGMVMSDDAVSAGVKFRDTLDTLKRSAEGFRNTIGAQLLPGLQSVVEGFIGIINGQEGANKKLAEGAAQIVESISAVLPGVVAMASGIVEAIGAVAPTIVKSLVDGIVSNIPVLVSAANSIVSSLLAAIITALPELAKGAIELVTSLAEAILSNVGALIKAGAEVIIAIFQGLSKSIPVLIPAIVLAITQIISTIMENLPLIISAGLEMLLALVRGIIDNLPVLITAIVSMIPMLVQTIMGSLTLIIEAGIEIILALVDGIVQSLPVIISCIVDMIPMLVSAVVENLPKLIEAGIEMLLSLILGIVDALPQIIQCIVDMIPMLVKAIIENLPKLIQAGIKILVSVIKGIVEALPQIIKTIVEMIPMLVQTIIENLPQIIAAGIEIVLALVCGIAEAVWSVLKAAGQLAWDFLKGIWKGIGDGAKWLWDQISGFFSEIWRRIKNFFGVASPSKLFAGLGKELDRGLAKGVLDNLPIVDSAMDKLAGAVAGVKSNFAINANIGGAKGRENGGVLLNIYTNNLDEGQINMLVNTVNRRLGLAY